MDWMYSNCSATAQRGALDWKDRFRDAVAPVFDALYESVVTGKETQIVLDAGKDPNYREKLQKELEVIHNSEMWRAGAAVRDLRPERRKK
jgi:ketol-acid reductoisomerase